MKSSGVAAAGEERREGGKFSLVQERERERDISLNPGLGLSSQESSLSNIRLL